MSGNSIQRQASGIDSNQENEVQETTDEEPEVERPVDAEAPAYHYVKNYDYNVEEFAQEGEVLQFNGIRVINSSDHEDQAEFEDFAELNQSNWRVNTASAVRLATGTILYEGQR